MHHPTRFPRALLLHDAQGIRSRLTGMNNQRLASFTRGPDMRAKAFALPFQIAGETKIVETGFADRHDARVIR